MKRRNKREEKKVMTPKEQYEERKAERKVKQAKMSTFEAREFETIELMDRFVTSLERAVVVYEKRFAIEYPQSKTR